MSNRKKRSNNSRKGGHNNSYPNYSADLSKMRQPTLREGYVTVIEESPSKAGASAETELVHLISRGVCDSAQIRFGPKLISKMHNGFYQIERCSVDNRKWVMNLGRLTLPNSSADYLSVQLTPNLVERISAGFESDKLLLQIVPTPELFDHLTGLFGPQDENCPGGNDERMRCLFINMNGCPQSSKALLIAELRQNAVALKLDMLMDTEMDDIMAKMFGETLKTAAAKSVVAADTKKQTFQCLQVGIGSFEAKNMLITLDLLKSTVVVHPDITSVGAVSVPWDGEYIHFDPTHLVAIFQFRDPVAIHLTTELLKFYKVHKSKELLSAETKLDHSVIRLRVLFRPDGKNIQLLPMLMKKFGWSDKIYIPRKSYEAFPKHPPLRALRGSSHDSSVSATFSNMSVSHKPLNSTLNVNKSKTRTEVAIVNPGPSMAGNASSVGDKENHGTSRYFSQNGSRAHQSVPARVLVPSTKVARSNSLNADRENRKRLKGAEEVVELEDDNDVPTVSHASRPNRPSRRSEYVKLFSSFPGSISEEVKEKLRIKNQPHVQRTSSRSTRAHSVASTKSDQPEVNDATVPGSDLIDLCDDEEMEVDKEEPETTAPVGKMTIPEGAHPMFQNLHNFGDLTLLNSLVHHEEVYQLAKGQMLGDGIVQMMLEYGQNGRREEDRKIIHVLPYFFFQTYSNGMKGQNLDKVTEVPAALLERIRSNVKIEIFDYEYLLVPVLNEQHWYILLVCHPGDQAVTYQEPCFVILDSLVSTGSSARHTYTFKMIELWLKTEFRAKFNKPKDYRASQYPRIIPQLPQQENGVDCGVFMLRNMSKVLNEKPVFGVKITPATDYSGRKPDLSWWYRTDETFVECMRLHLLDLYYRVAQFKQCFVYRQNYITDLISCLLKDGSKLIKLEDMVDLSESPMKPSKKEKVLQMESSSNNEAEQTVPSEVKPSSLPKSCILVEDHLLMKPPHLEFFGMAGAPVQYPNEIKNSESERELTPAEKIKMRAGRKNAKRLWLKPQSPSSQQQRPIGTLMKNGKERKTAEQLYTDLLNGVAEVRDPLDG